jgi:hypothetical protein
VRIRKIISQNGLRHRPELYFCPDWRVTGKNAKHCYVF